MLDLPPKARKRAPFVLIAGTAGALIVHLGGCTLIVDERLSQKDPEAADSGDEGDCGACNVEHGKGLCVEGACVIAMCDKDFADCDHVASNGCERHTTDDRLNCGACDHVCNTGEGTCSGGTCK
jgi:hypothetical protein